MIVVDSRVRTVCSIDDDEAVRESLRALLESHGMNVHAYASALEFLGDSKAATKNTDCFILDLHMPGMSGIELLELMRDRGTDTPVIVLTGRGDVDLLSRARKSGAVVVLDKPVTENVLLKAIDDAVTAPRSIAQSSG